jgi:WD40 repeat protein
MRRFKGHEAKITGLSLLNDGHAFVSASLDRTLRLWDVDGGVVTSVIILDEAITALSTRVDDRTVAVGDAVGRVIGFRLAPQDPQRVS